MRDDLEALLRVTLVPGMGPLSQQKLLHAFDGPHGVLRARTADVQHVVEPEVAAALARGADPALVTRTLEWAGRPDRHVVVMGDAQYPEALMQVDVPPTMLYAIGDPAWLSKPAFAIVGSRNATRHGLEDAQEFARALAQVGLTIVSGLAHGVDAAAHRGALDAAGSTVAVMGTGPDRIYPRANAALATDIAERGCLVTEFPLGTHAAALNFPRRNRLISGLAKAVLVVQAAEESGSLITARLAAEQGRDVFALPGSIHSPLAKGCHKLIKEGAKLVDDVDDILSELGVAPRAGLKRAPAPSHFLLAAMGFDALTVDEILARTGTTFASIAVELSALEIDGRIEALAGGRYQQVVSR